VIFFTIYLVSLRFILPNVAINLKLRKRKILSLSKDISECKTSALIYTNAYRKIINKGSRISSQRALKISASIHNYSNKNDIIAKNGLNFSPSFDPVINSLISIYLKNFLRENLAGKIVS